MYGKVLRLKKFLLCHKTDREDENSVTVASVVRHRESAVGHITVFVQQRNSIVEQVLGSVNIETQVWRRTSFLLCCT